MQVLPYEYDMSSILVWVAQGGQNTFWNRSGPFLNGVWLVSLWCLTGTLTLETFCTFCQTLLHTLSICYVSSSSITTCSGRKKRIINIFSVTLLTVASHKLKHLNPVLPLEPNLLHKGLFTYYVSEIGGFQTAPLPSSAMVSICRTPPPPLAINRHLREPPFPLWIFKFKQKHFLTF